MKTRKEVADYINSLDGIYLDYPNILNTVCKDKAAYHWGKCEIRSLLDFIYEGLPSKEEEVFRPLGLRNIAGKRL